MSSVRCALGISGCTCCRSLADCGPLARRRVYPCWTSGWSGCTQRCLFGRQSFGSSSRRALVQRGCSWLVRGAGCLAVTQEDDLPAGPEADCRAGCDERRSSVFARIPTGERDGGRVGVKGPAGGAAVGGPRVFSWPGDARDAFRPAGCGASVGRRVRTVRRLADACRRRMARPAGSSGSDSDRMRSVASSRVLRLLASVRCGLRSLCSSRAQAR